MRLTKYSKNAWSDFLSAVEFLTRVPLPSRPYEADSLARSVKFFPVVGLCIGASAALLHFMLAPHLPRTVTALLVLLFLVIVTGGLHEDGLADAADGFGGGTGREQILRIFHDSRIGSYGGMALVLSLMGRLLLLASLSSERVLYCLIAAHVLCRWTTLPLSYFLPSARAEKDAGNEGQGARIARLVTPHALLAGSLFTFATIILILRGSAISAILAAIAVSAFTGLYYKRRIGGVTGDCFGATNQLTEIAVYVCGVWVR